jgi:hypothetical protein
VVRLSIGFFWRRITFETRRTKLAEMAGGLGSLTSKVVGATGVSNAVTCRIHRSDGRSLCSQRSRYLLLEI